MGRQVVAGVRPGVALVVLFVGLLLPAWGAAAGPLREIKTRHYRIHTDLDRALADDLARRMDGMYDEYSRRLSTFTTGREIPALEVYLFRRQEDYLKFTGEKMRNTGGVFMSGRNLLAAFLEGQGRDALRRTLQHEAFHQFAHTVISPELPVWLNEGMAQVFEEGIWTGSDFWPEQAPPRRIRQLQDDMKHRRLIDFRVLTSMTNEQWSENLHKDHGTGATQYNQSWAMVYFLINARDEDGREKYRGRLLQMLQLIHGGRDPQEAFNVAFAGNLAGFQKRFVEYARELRATPEATLIENQEVLADLLSELRNRGKTFDTIADLRQAAVRGGYQMHYTRGQLKWSSKADLTTYFRDLDGRPFDADQLYLSPRTGAPLPDIVCRYSDKIQFRTRFHDDGKQTEHEVVVESVSRSARAE
jgi:hypothetical protein